MPKVYRERRCFTYRNLFTLRNTNKIADGAHRSRPHGFPDKGRKTTFPCPAPVRKKDQEQGGLPQAVLPHTFPLERRRQDYTLLLAQLGFPAKAMLLGMMREVWKNSLARPPAALSPTSPCHQQSLKEGHLPLQEFRALHPRIYSRYEHCYATCILQPS